VASTLEVMVRDTNGDSRFGLALKTLARTYTRPNWGGCSSGRELTTLSQSTTTGTAVLKRSLYVVSVLNKQTTDELLRRLVHTTAPRMRSRGASEPVGRFGAQRRGS